MNYTKFSIILKEKPPYFIGSQLRGAFGYALKRVVCINPSFKCNDCFASSSCLFYNFYEQKGVFHKYRFDYELGKNFYDFNFYLFDDVVDKLPYIVSAFYKLFTEIGLGKDRKTYTNFDMFVNDEMINENNNLKIPKEYKQEFKVESFSESVTIILKTPIRIKKNNKFVRVEELNLFDIFNSIYQRKLSLTNQERKKYPYNVSANIIEKDLSFKKLTRLSNRQKTKMSFDGIIGTIKVNNLSNEEFELLKLGEIIGVGKQTTFGLGKIEIIS